MKWNVRFIAFLIVAMIAGAGCSVLPGLKVLSGQDTGDAAENRLVESSELVMANKSGVTDPTLNSVADRIETAAAGSLDVIEIRNDLNNREFDVYALYATDPSLSQQQQVDRERRAFELTWRGVMQQSLGDDTLNIRLIYPIPVTTLDKGPSFVGYIIATATIARKDALLYLNGNPSLQGFVDLVSAGTIAFDQPAQPPLYEGTPNHPVFMTSQMSNNSSSQ